MKKVIILSIAALALVGCSHNKNTATNTTDTSATEATMQAQQSPDAMMAKSMTVTLASQNNSQQSGTAMLDEVDGKVKVTLNLSGGAFTQPQPAHIHTGACPVPGGVKHPLTNVVNGNSETTLETTMADLMAGLPLAVNVHKSQAESTVYTACGDLK